MSKPELVEDKLDVECPECGFHLTVEVTGPDFCECFDGDRPWDNLKQYVDLHTIVDPAFLEEYPRCPCNECDGEVSVTFENR